MNSVRIRAALTALAAGLLSACAALPEAPSLPDSVSARWSTESAALAPGERPLDWWREFDDAQLDALVAEALAGNRDLVAADARLRATRALAREARLAQGPSGDASAQLARTRTAALAQPPVEGTPAEFPTQRLVDLELGFRWQLDLAGGRSAARAAAVADATEMLWQRRQVEAGVAAATVAAWFDRDDARRALVVLEARVEALGAVRQRLRGAVALGAVREADAALADFASAQAQAAMLERRFALRNAERRLATLTNRPIDTLRLEDASSGYPARLPIVDPLAALRARPDVGAAEARVRAALARAGVAQAALYPDITLVAPVGLSAPGSELSEPGARRFTAGATLVWGLFDLPRLRAQANAAAAQADAEIASFHSTTLAALEEADGAIDGWQSAVAAARHIDSARVSAARAAALIAARRDAGLTSALDVARARADAMEWELAAIDADGQARRAWIGALLALGAGWRDVELRP